MGRFISAVAGFGYSGRGRLGDETETVNEQGCFGLVGAEALVFVELFWRTLPILTGP